MNIAPPENSFKYSLSAFKLILTGVLTAFAGFGCSAAILNGGLEEKSFIEGFYLCLITVSCFAISFLNGMNLFKKNKMIEIYHDHISVPSLWSSNRNNIFYKDIVDITFNDGHSTAVPPYMIIKYEGSKQIGIGSARMLAEDYENLSQSLKDKTGCKDVLYSA